ncbi:hypothetical protein X801_01616 [Opisthorchis viverrini]|uniref:Uncharacterized protein n=1 Tax=Opisthorchis viverrini TaxID=6198 RepID=A0A1S8X6X0_OPIVI|nr:hypothetical protein X801_01616 [Opisthorchis viverrini]
MYLFRFHMSPPREQLRALYPNKFIKYDEKRIEIMNTLFSLPEIHMLSCIINMLISDPTHIQLDKGVKKGNLYMSYTSVYEDVREAREWMHEGRERAIKLLSSALGRIETAHIG